MFLTVEIEMQKIFPLIGMGNENGAMDFVDVVAIVETVGML